MAPPPAPGADQGPRPGLGAERVRHALLRLPALHRQAGCLRRRRLAADLNDERRLGRARQSWRLVDRADRLPEGGDLDDALGGARPRRRLAAADAALLTDDRRRPLLAAAGDYPPAALAGASAADPRHPAHALRRRPLRGPDRRRAQPAALQRHRRGCRHGGAPRSSRRRRPACPPRLTRSARQGSLPRRPRGDLRQLGDHLPLSADEHDHRRAARLRLHLVGRRFLEAQPPLPLRGHGDDQQHALEQVAGGEAAALPRLSQ